MTALFHWKKTACSYFLYVILFFSSSFFLLFRNEIKMEVRKRETRKGKFSCLIYIHMSVKTCSHGQGNGTATILRLFLYFYFTLFYFIFLHFLFRLFFLYSCFPGGFSTCVCVCVCVGLPLFYYEEHRHLFLSEIIWGKRRRFGFFPFLLDLLPMNTVELKWKYISKYVFQELRSYNRPPVNGRWKSRPLYLLVYRYSKCINFVFLILFMSLFFLAHSEYENDRWTNNIFFKLVKMFSSRKVTWKKA